MPNWFVSGLMMDRALDAIMRRVKKIDRAHDVPYLAGYSRNGKTIYIDRHMPPSVVRSIPIDRGACELHAEGLAISNDKPVIWHSKRVARRSRDSNLIVLNERQARPEIRGAVRAKATAQTVFAEHLARDLRRAKDT